MTALLNVPVPAAGTFVGPLYQLRVPAGANPVMMAQATLAYGSGGTSINVYLQSSIDGGTTWSDVISFTQMLLANSRQAAAVVPGSANAAAATDGTLTQTTNNPAVFGEWWRVKYIVVGAYVTSNLRVDAFANVGLVPAGAGT